MATRLRRIEQVERNREVVLDAARRVFLARGYAGATLEAIAEEAGFSKGVVYSQFGSKADLFLALLERRIDERAAHNEHLAETVDGLGAITELLRVARRDNEAELGWSQLLVEFRIVASRDPVLQARYSAAHARTIDRLAGVLTRVHERAGVPLAAPARAMAEFVLAVGSGITLERLANPDALPAEHLIHMVPSAIGAPAPAHGEAR
jgi:AcrR family transcriptional regulator